MPHPLFSRKRQYQAIAKESGATFINVRMGAVQQKWVGEGEKMVAAIFRCSTGAPFACHRGCGFDSLVSRRVPETSLSLALLSRVVGRSRLGDRSFHCLPERRSVVVASVRLLWPTFACCSPYLFEDVWQSPVSCSTPVHAAVFFMYVPS